MDSKQLISFKDYSKKYDLLLQYSPPYQELIQLFLGEIKKHFSKETHFSVLDIGGGTGNFSEILVKNYPNATIDILEPSKEMRNVAQNKLKGQKVSYHNETFEHFKTPKKYDLVICMHALYLMPHPNTMIKKFSTFLNPDSKLIVCDIGKVINVNEWTLSLLPTLLKQHGIRKTWRIMRMSSEIRKANKPYSRNNLLANFGCIRLINLKVISNNSIPFSLLSHAIEITVISLFANINESNSSFHRSKYKESFWALFILSISPFIGRLINPQFRDFIRPSVTLSLN